MLIKSSKYKLFLFPSIIFLIGLNLFPILYAIFISFTNFELLKNQSIKLTGSENYSLIFNDELFSTALSNTAMIVLVASVIETVLGVFLAIILYSYIKKSKKIIQAIIITPMALTPVAIALMWKYMFNSTYGIINYLLSLIGVTGIDWLGSLQWSLFSIIIVDIWQWTPFIFILTLAGIESIPKKLIDMIRVDGASYLQTLRYVISPYIISFVILAFLIRIIDSFKLFDKVYILTEGGPGSSTETLSLLGYRLGFIFFRTNLASAESIVMLIIITIFIVLSLRLLKNLITV